MSEKSVDVALISSLTKIYSAVCIKTSILSQQVISQGFARSWFLADQNHTRYLFSDA